jgi:hypothetical protein
MLDLLIVAFVQFVIMLVELNESTRSGTKVTIRRASFSRSSKLEHMAEILSI